MNTESMNTEESKPREIGNRRIRCDQPLAPLTSWKIGGRAAYLSRPASLAELEDDLRWAVDRGVPVLALGGGSNVLIADAGYPGLVLLYSDSATRIETDREAALLRIGSREPLARAARTTAREGWSGLQWGEGIPGTIGGAVVGNAGAYGGMLSDQIDWVETYSLDAGVRRFTAEECGFEYRKSRFKGQDPTRLFIVSAAIRLRRGDPAELNREIGRIAAERRARTPAGLSCGSVFKNPPGTAAGKLVEEVGLKGATCGGARISPLHANYVQNMGGASARDVLELIELARATVRTKLGIELELEVQPIGFPV